MPSILVVEDDEGAREALSDILREEGFDVRLAANGREALEQLEEGMRPCVILLDLVMPVMDGWEFRQRQLRHEGLAPIPVVVLTATAGDGPEAVPASDVLRKPVDFDALLERVERHCVRRAELEAPLN
jgi:CheY-like chemotaxis protein